MKKLLLFLVIALGMMNVQHVLASEAGDLNTTLDVQSEPTNVVNENIGLGNTPPTDKITLNKKTVLLMGLLFVSGFLLGIQYVRINIEAYYGAYKDAKVMAKYGGTRYPVGYVPYGCAPGG